MKMFLFLVCVAILAGIFLRRYQFTAKGISYMKMFGKGKNIFSSPWVKSVFHRQHEENKSGPAGTHHDLTIREMIPSADTVDAKDAAKASTLFKRAEAFLEKGDLQNAEKTLIQTISLDPSLQEAYHKLGLIYLKQEQFGRAETIYRKLIVAKNDEAAYFSNLGLSLYQQNKLHDAKSFYEKALQLDQSRPGRFFSLGKILHELQEFEQALNHFQKAVAMDPRNLNYLLTMAQLYIDQGMKGQAHKILSEILVAFPENEEATEMMKGV